MLDDDGILQGEPRYGSEFPKRLTPGELHSELFAGHDGPDQAFDYFVTAELFIHERFKYFVMFRSIKPDSIWVPLQKVEWWWRARIRSNRVEPRLVEAASGIGRGSRTTELPVWDGHTNRWHYWRPTFGG
jgi:hypothetical protein